MHEGQALSSDSVNPLEVQADERERQLCLQWPLSSLQGVLAQGTGCWTFRLSQPKSLTDSDQPHPRESCGSTLASVTWVLLLAWGGCVDDACRASLRSHLISDII